jgi:uncharacterized protein YjiS (DUF1127 family)
MRWITSERPKIDHIACSWLIQRFVDHDADFRFVPANDVLAEARRSGAVPFDVPGAELRRVGRLCSFDAVLAKYRIDDSALRLLAAIVRAADCGHTAWAPQSAGLLAVSYGLSRCFHNDDELLQQGFVVYDALYRWCRKAPPGPDFAIPPVMPWPEIGWWQALRQHRSRVRAGRALAALNEATLRDIGLERTAAEPGPRDAFDLRARAICARPLLHASGTPPRLLARPATRPSRLIPSGTAALAWAALAWAALAWAASSIGRARQRRALACLDDRLLRDIGLSRAAAAREAAKPFWRD